MREGERWTKTAEKGYEKSSSMRKCSSVVIFICSVYQKTFQFQRIGGGGGGSGSLSISPCTYLELQLVKKAPPPSDNRIIKKYLVLN